MKTEGDELKNVETVVRENSTLFVLSGGGLIFAGIAAIYFPIFSALTLNYMVGVVLFIGGAMTVLGSFSVRGAGPFFGFFLAGSVEVGIGLFLINNPLLGTGLVTFGAGFVFLISGAYQMSMAMSGAKNRLSVLLWLPAAVNTCLGFIVISGMLGGRPVLIGVAIGVNFIVTGGSMISFARMIKDPDE